MWNETEEPYVMPVTSQSKTYVVGERSSSHDRVYGATPVSLHGPTMASFSSSTALLGMCHPVACPAGSKVGAVANTQAHSSDHGAGLTRVKQVN